MLYNIYVYKYYIYKDIINEIKKYQFDREYYNDIEVYSIYNLKSKCLIEAQFDNTIYLYNNFTVCIYKNYNIVIFLTEKYQHIKSFCKDINLVKYNLLSIDCFKALTNREFSRSLTNINLQFDYSNNEGETFELTGSEIDGLEVLYDLGLKNCYENVKIKSYSIQPLKSRYIMNIKSINRIEIKRKCEIKEIMDMLFRFVDRISLCEVNR